MSLLQYLKDTKSELVHVSWPTRRQVVIFSVAVLIISAVVAVLLGAFDMGFKFLIDVFII